jgi:hypothetical protein
MFLLVWLFGSARFLNGRCSTVWLTFVRFDNTKIKMLSDAERVDVRQNDGLHATSVYFTNLFESQQVVKNLVFFYLLRRLLFA